MTFINNPPDESNPEMGLTVPSSMLLLKMPSVIQKKNYWVPFGQTAMFDDCVDEEIDGIAIRGGALSCCVETVFEVEILTNWEHEANFREKEDSKNLKEIINGINSRERENNYKKYLIDRGYSDHHIKAVLKNDPSRMAQ